MSISCVVAISQDFLHMEKIFFNGAETEEYL